MRANVARHAASAPGRRIAATSVAIARDRRAAQTRRFVSRPIIAAAGLRKRYGTHEVVRGIDFTVEPRECFGLLGPNGAGKTTAIRMITCFSPVTDGRLEVFGLPVEPRNHRAIKSRLGLAPQEETLDPDVTVEMNLLLYASYFGLTGAEARGRIASLLAFAALES